MEKSILLANLDEVLKDIHPTNQLVKDVAIKAIESLFTTEEKKEEYVVKLTREEGRFHDKWEAWDIIGMYNTIFEKIGMPANVTYGGSGDGDFISFKLAS